MMADQQVINVQNMTIDQKQLSRQLVDRLDDVLRDGYILRDIMAVLHKTYFHPRNLYVLKGPYDDYLVMHQRDDGTGKGELYTHPTLTACVEFALKWNEE